MPVIIEHGYNGLLAGTEQEFEECLRRVKDGEIKPENCRRSVAERFSATVMAERYVQLHQEIFDGAVAGARRRGPDELVEFDGRSAGL